MNYHKEKDKTSNKYHKLPFSHYSYQCQICRKYQQLKKLIDTKTGWICEKCWEG